MNLGSQQVGRFFFLKNKKVLVPLFALPLATVRLWTLAVIEAYRSLIHSPLLVIVRTKRNSECAKCFKRTTGKTFTNGRKFYGMSWSSTCGGTDFACMLTGSEVSDSLQPHGLQPLGSSVHGITQARILEWAAISSSRGSSRSRDWTHIPVSCIGRWILLPLSYLGSPPTWHPANIKFVLPMPYHSDL